MRSFRLSGIALVAAVACTGTRADVSLNNMFGDHMVLQQGIRTKVWGRADPGEAVTVTFAGQSHATTTGPDGAWQVFLDPVAEYGGPHVLAVKGTNELSFRDVLVGEVWLCSGQSNMEWTVNKANDADVEKAAARFPAIRLLSVPRTAAREPQWNFTGQWQVCGPETVGEFSAVGYFFGRQLHQTLGVPIGLIDNAWGGSSAEAWVRRDKLAAHDSLKVIHERWATQEADLAAAVAAFPGQLAEWEAAAKEAQAAGQPVPERPRPPDETKLKDNHRPGTIHAGVLAPSIGYGIRGVIWYQGESNARRASEYHTLFPFLITSWREEWGLGDFPFYWVQLADFKAEQPKPGESTWAELREAQTRTMQSLPNTGQAVIIDLGEGKDIHPTNKQDVATRLVRWALAETYRVPGIACRSPIYTGLEHEGSKLVLSFDHVTGGWRPFDVAEPRGFMIAGADGNFVPARAAIRADGRIDVWSDEVAAPVAVRYAWADNPVCNMYSAAGLPLTPFRTDEHPGVGPGGE